MSQCIESVSINYNMRCIETGMKNMVKQKVAEINYNMRCIETGIYEMTMDAQYR